MKPACFLLAAHALAGSSGCGLLFLPHIAALPPKHFQSITVREAGSKKLLENATIRFQAGYGTNWLRFDQRGLHATSNSDVAIKKSLPVMMTAKQDSPGHFVFRPIFRLEWSHVWLPLCPPLGGVLYHYYNGGITVEAPGHTSIQVCGKPPIREPSPHFEYTDHLTVYLAEVDEQTTSAKAAP